MSSPDSSHTHFCPWASVWVTTDQTHIICNVIIIIMRVSGMGLRCRCRGGNDGRIHDAMRP